MAKQSRNYRRRESGLIVSDDDFAVPNSEHKPWYAGRLLNDKHNVQFKSSGVILFSAPGTIAMAPACCCNQVACDLCQGGIAPASMLYTVANAGTGDNWCSSYPYSQCDGSGMNGAYVASQYSGCSWATDVLDIFLCGSEGPPDTRIWLYRISGGLYYSASRYSYSATINFINKCGRWMSYMYWEDLGAVVPDCYVFDNQNLSRSGSGSTPCGNPTLSITTI